MTLARISAPVVEPITLVEAKNHLRVEHDAEDVLIEALIAAARSHVEHASGQKLITQTWRQFTDYPAHGEVIDLHLSPLQHLVSVTAYNVAGDATSISFSDVSFNKAGRTIRISNSINPLDTANGLEIDLIVGFGDTGVDVPDGIKRAVLLLLSHWYEFRGAVSPQDHPVALPPGFASLILPYREMRL